MNLVLSDQFDFGTTVNKEKKEKEAVIYLDTGYILQKLVYERGCSSLYYGDRQPVPLDLFLKIFHLRIVVDGELVDIDSRDLDKDIKKRVDIFLDELVNQVARCVEFEHPKISRLVDCAFYGSQGPVFMSTALDGIPLFQYLEENGPLSLDQIVKLFKELVDLLNDAREEEIYHGNLTTDVVFVDHDDPTDISVMSWFIAPSVQALASVELLTRYETRAYPTEDFQSLIDNKSSLPFDTARDIFGLATLLIEAMTGIPLFLSNDEDNFQNVSPETLIKERDFDIVFYLEKFNIDKEVGRVFKKALGPLDSRYATIEMFYQDFCAAIGWHDESYPASETPVEVIAPRHPEFPEKNELYFVEKEENKELLTLPLEFVANDRRNMPSPQGRHFAIALVLLIVTNLAWALIAFDRLESVEQKTGESHDATPLKIKDQLEETTKLEQTMK